MGPQQAEHADRRRSRRIWTAYELGVASAKVYDFIWDTYCDWYIELTKTRLNGDGRGRQADRTERARATCW